MTSLFGHVTIAVARMIDRHHRLSAVNLTLRFNQKHHLDEVYRFELLLLLLLLLLMMMMMKMMMMMMARMVKRL